MILKIIKLRFWILKSKTFQKIVSINILEIGNYKDPILLIWIIGLYKELDENKKFHKLITVFKQ